MIKAVPGFLLPIFLALFITPGIHAQTLDTSMVSTDGKVETVFRSGNTIYLGGKFSYVGPSYGLDNKAIIDTLPGGPAHRFPKIEGGQYDPYAFVNDIISDGKGGWFICGGFRKVGGVPRINLAHINADHSVDANWQSDMNDWPSPSVGQAVYKMLLKGNTLYIAGYFNSVQGQPRPSLAALDATSGKVTPWNPPAFDGYLPQVNGIGIIGNTLYAGGNFYLAELQRRNVIAFDLTTGQPTDFKADVGNNQYEYVFGLLAHNNTVYVHGTFHQANGQARGPVAALDATTGALKSWDPAFERSDGDPGVHRMVGYGNKLYVAGSFHAAGGQPRLNFAVLDANTGAATAWDPALPRVEGASGVSFMALSGNLLYLSGWFKSIGGKARNYLAALDVTTDSVTAWNPNPASPIGRIAVSGRQVYISGSVADALYVNGEHRENLAAIDAVTGKIKPWNPGANNTVKAIQAVGTKVFVGGLFDKAGNAPRNRLAAVDAGTGLLTDWNPKVSGQGTWPQINALAVAGQYLFVGGSFYSIDNQTRNGLVAVDLNTGRVAPWDPKLSNNQQNRINCLKVKNNLLYAGGSFAIPGAAARTNLAALHVGTALPAYWNPAPDGEVFAIDILNDVLFAGGNFSNIGGQPRSRLASVDLASGSATTWVPAINNTVASVAVLGDNLYAGGSFTLVNGQPRSYLAALHTLSGTLAGWTPDVDGAVSTLVAFGKTLYAGGAFGKAGAHPVKGVAAFGERTIVAHNYIQGNIFADGNGDCTRNATERGLNNLLVVAEPGPYYGSSDSLGNYTIAVDTGAYSVRQLLPVDKSTFIRQTCPPAGAARTVRFGTYHNTASGQDFGNAVTQTPFLTVSVASNRRRRCFSSLTTISYCNSGSAPANDVTVHLELPGHVRFVGSAHPHTRNGEQHFVFAVGTLAPGQCGTISVTDSVACGDPAIRGLTQCTRAWITPANPVTPGDGWDQSDIRLKATCLDGERVGLVVYNQGNGDMADSSAYRVLLDARAVYSGKFRLQAGDSLRLQVTSEGQTVRLEADQRPGHPLKSATSITQEACGRNAEGKASTGYVNLLSPDDAEPEVDVECLPIVDSFDPNDKLVLPAGVTDSLYTPVNTDLQYTIRFQNTGTDYAYQVTLVDTLSEHLNLNTFKAGAASHPYQLSITGKGRPVLTWTFNNINLPDSARNQAASNGYVTFTIRPLGAIAPKTAIANHADIFFDYNPAVRTNTVLNRIYDLPPPAVNAPRVVVCNLARPAVVQAGTDSLQCSVTGDSYRWFLNGAPLAAQTRVINASRAGMYTVQVVRQNCASALSDPLSYTITGLEPGWGNAVRIYPNPSTGTFVLQMEGQPGADVALVLYDARGRQLWGKHLHGKDNQPVEERIQLTRYTPGIYFLKVSTSRGSLTRKLLLR